MNAIGRLAAGVAHDFNNILQTVSSSLELVLDNAVPGTREHELLSIGLRSTGRGSSLTHQLLAYARKQMLEPRDVEVRALLSDIEGLLARTLDPRVVIETWCDSDGVRVRVDAGQLQTALLNLAINASHAMPDGGTLSIAARAAHELGERWVVIAVTDTGTGMDETTLAQALEPFFTTKGQEGTGLGLPMVQGFVEQSGGKFRIRSTLGVGTTIEMLLPPAGDAATDCEAIAPPPDRRRKSGCVVLVDDDADVLVTTASFLEKSGFRVMRAANANQALALLAGNTRVDAIVSDFAMPGMNGLDLVAEARLRRPNLPAILISGFIDIKDTGPIENHTVRLQKPFQRADLIEALQDLMVTAIVDGDRPDEPATLGADG
jgi:CheY-like chemotaxis protein/two-component sensor histidine kinase